MPYEPQLDALKTGVDVVVGTPGRLLDLANRRALDLSHVKVLVLDEADEMLDLGFLPDVERLLAKTPETRQTMLFSATMPGAIVSLARTHMRHPVNIRAESAADTQTVPATAQFIYQVHDLDKIEMIARILQAENSGLDDRASPAPSAPPSGSPTTSPSAASRPARCTATWRRWPARRRWRGSARARSGCSSRPTSRPAASTSPTSPTSSTTAAPRTRTTYVHRIGRTGRAGATGVAITFVDWADVTRWKVINKALGLPFEDPAETYSTSEHFFHDLGIAHGAKGRVGPRWRRRARRSRRVRRVRLVRGRPAAVGGSGRLRRP